LSGSGPIVYAIDPKHFRPQRYHRRARLRLLRRVAYGDNTRQSWDFGDKPTGNLVSNLARHSIALSFLGRRL
jgi:hypothetical protein